MGVFYAVIMALMSFINEHADTRLKRLAVLIVIMSVSLLVGRLSNKVSI